LYHPDIPCAILTHQLTIAVPVRSIQNLLQQFHYRLLNRFSVVWVPDLAGPINAAGLLSHPEKRPKVPVQYIGWLSRFHATGNLPTYKYCVLLSGPEPQRTLLEEKLLSSFNRIHEKVLFIRGLPGEEHLPITGKHIICYNHLKEADLQTALQEAEWVISRSGYTTVMELLSLKKKSILLPTPGQTEQVYLAKRLPALGWAFSADQENLQLEEVLKAAENFSFQTPPPGSFESDKWLLELKRMLSH
jgi:UDP-N-acetylglucosamine transferase subunit ALG13